ncbi:androgen dependent TFPI regulating protein 1 isoform X2 [Stegostoma tigrinum]|uniref:androgen dependent TFPI regulating protein 1 isoform X2 n=1 Tax=Stegostoma tigrinum TaxID=3053191 RepID=UPI00287011CA|nr:androgen dependent TFPI regulating protein 1 isoform X2 [Stegostoma tigrinum]
MVSRRVPLIFHLPAFLWYIFVLHQDTLLTSGGRLLGAGTYGGRWKYLTFINMFVVVSFWILYAYDRELVYPEQLDKIIPTWLNHAMHTVVLVLLMLELFVVQHRWPNRKGCLVVLVTFCSSYLLWVLWIRHRSSIWVYPILEALSPIGLCIFLTAAVLVTVCLYVVGEKLHRWKWGLPDQCGKKSCYFDRDPSQECRLNSAGKAASEKHSNPDIPHSASPSTAPTVSESCGNPTPFPDPFQQKLLDLQKEGFEHLAVKLDQMIDLMGNIAQSLSALPLIQAEPSVPVIHCPSPATVSHRAKPSTPEQSESTIDPSGDPELDTDTQKEIDYQKPVRLPLKSQLPSLRRTMKPTSSVSSGVNAVSSVELKQAGQGSSSLIPNL